MTMEYAYFPGCSASSTGISFTKSTDYVAAKIGFQMHEIPDWCCCGTSAARLTSFDLGNALPARSLALAEAAFPELDIVAPCAGCYQALKAASNYVRQSDENLEHIKELIELPLEGKQEVVSLLEAFAADDVKQAVASTVVKKLTTLKAACYYGCALVRPAGVCNFDDPEDPQSMDELMRIIGVEPIDWAFKTECCGASTQMTTVDVARPLIANIFRNAVANGAECIVTACPLCWMNLDMRLEELNKKRVAAGEAPYDIPVYYFTELIGIAQGATSAEVGIDLHFHPGEALIARKEVEAAEKAAADAKAAEEAAAKEAERAAKIAAAKAAKAAKAKAAAEEAPAEEAPAAEPAPEGKEATDE